jgi:uncharacterized protein with HEPN domain
MDYAGFVKGSKTVDAALRNVEVIGEATKTARSPTVA